MNEIEQLKNEFIKQLSPEKIYLFGFQEQSLLVDFCFI